MLVWFPSLVLTICILNIRKQRYVYGTILDSIAKVKGVIKFDLHAEPEPGKTELEVGGNILGIYDLGPGKFGSEAIYVPRVPGIDSEEDDGYLIFFVHDENTGYNFPLHPKESDFSARLVQNGNEKSGNMNDKLLFGFVCVCGKLSFQESQFMMYSLRS